MKCAKCGLSVKKCSIHYGKRIFHPECFSQHKQAEISAVSVIRRIQRESKDLSIDVVFILETIK